MATKASAQEKLETFRTRGGVTIVRSIEEIPAETAVEPLVDALDARRGVLLASSFEYPGRYTRWDLGFVDPPLELSSRERDFTLRALNDRGKVILSFLAPPIQALEAVADSKKTDDLLSGTIRRPSGFFPEEERSRQPTVFSVLRSVVDTLATDADPHLGLYGAFGYDLAFQFEPLRLRLARSADRRELVLYIPDELLVVDHPKQRATRFRYDFESEGRSTRGLSRETEVVPYVGSSRRTGPECDHAPGEYASVVRKAHEAFHRGDLFEAVPGQTFFEPCPVPPSELFRRLRERNPAPYGFLINLGKAEYLVGASPEMYVRVEGSRVETCPISGTIARGIDPIADAARIQELLNSAKDAAELTMCTDVDRNDKSRICRAGTVRVIGRRQIEMYSRLIHTVDHVEGHLRDEFDALDAFLAHAWAVTVTGAPKTWAMQFIEDHEKTPRDWYGGAIGRIGFDGNMNTGLTLRTIRVKDGAAQVRVGATLLFDSDPDAEEAETRVKASALIDAIRRSRGVPVDRSSEGPSSGDGKRIVLVDHQDSFVHTLANYLRKTGATVLTVRAGFPHDQIEAMRPDLLVLSPGPGRPSDFDLAGTISLAIAKKLPVFGVCLGLQGMVEFFGGELGVLPYPMHGKASRIRVGGGKIFAGLPAEFVAGRYHSLYALRDKLPRELVVSAETEDGTVMAIEHVDLPMAAVQFHPESILTLEGNVGMRLIRNVVTVLTGGKRT